MKTYAIDYETYYDDQCSIRNQGPWNYCADDEHWEAYLVSVVGPGLEYVGPPSKAPWAEIVDSDWVSHNALFDSTVHAQLGLPGPLGRWHCSADLAAFRGCKRSLDAAATYLLDKPVSKAMRNWMKGKRWIDAVNAGKDEELKKYAVDDSKVCLEIWEKEARHWPEKERCLSLHTRTMANRGIRIDKTAVLKAKETLADKRESIFKAIPWAPSEDKPLSLKKLQEHLATSGIPMPKSTSLSSAEYQAWEEKYSAHCEPIKLMADYRRANRLYKQLDTLQRFTRRDSTLGTQLKYFGAHTGRWSGEGGFNFQNMPAGELIGIDMRKFFIPREGKRLCIVDLSQIEARVLAWLVDDQDFLGAVRSGQSPYEAHARATMGWTGGKLKEEDPEKYKLAKMRVLGLGYGCGWSKFREIARLWAGWDLSDAESHNIVSDFRRANPKITRYWRGIERYIGAEMVAGKVEASIGLPSGRDLVYHELGAHGPRRQNLVASPVRGLPPRGLYGGILTENVVQAIARDVMAEAILRLESAGLPVVLHVHDEAVLEVDPGTDPREVEALMAQSPTWLDCPLGAEAQLSDFYTK